MRAGEPPFEKGGSPALFRKTLKGIEEEETMRRIMALLLSLILCIALMPALAGEEYTVTLYSQPMNLPASQTCKVWIEGQPLSVIDTAVNHQRVWTSRPMLSQTPVALFSMAGPVSVKVQFPGQALTSATVRPLSLGITPAVSGDTVSFILSKPAAVTVEYNNQVKGALHLFASALDEEIPDKADPNVIYFGPGLHEAGLIAPQSGQTVYLAGGCVLRGYIQAGGVKNVKIMGRGIIDGSAYDRWEDTIVPIDFTDSQDIHIEGITILDPAAWTVNLYRCKDVEIDGINIVAARSNSDGITTQSCENLTARNCFVRGWDDNLVVKGYDGNVKNILFENCVLWTDLAQSCEVGYETRADVMEDITFRNITVLHNFHKPVMSVHDSDNALVQNVRFENITVEDAQMGEGDGERFLIDLTTTKSQWSKSKTRGNIRGVVFDTIKVLSGKEASVRIFAFDKDHTIDDVLFRNLEILGRRVTSLKDMRMNTNKNIGADIRVEADAAVVTATYPGYLHTYKPKAQAPAAPLAGGAAFTAASNGQTQSYAAGNVADGNLNTYWEGAGTGSDELTLTFEKEFAPSSLALYLNPATIWGRRTQTFSVLGSADGTTFAELVPSQGYDFDPDTGNSVTLSLPGQPLMALKLVFTKNTGAAGAQAAEIVIN